MKPPAELDHYEILELPRSASREDVERAYRLALETYVEDSLAGYSIFADGDASALRERMNTAYRVLSDEEARRAYDASCAAPELQAPEPEIDLAPEPEPGPTDEPFEDLDEDASDWDGARLRRFRLRCGLDLEEIASVTKVNPVYLQCIEEERFKELPARVYVRGFVSAYAAAVGLDGGRVAASYLKRYEEGCGEKRRGRSW